MFISSGPIQFPTEVSNSNEEALDAYRLGFAVGDIDIIIGVVGDSFTFTWVPDNEVFTKQNFPAFFLSFKSNVEKETQGTFFMKFDNIIQRQVKALG